MSNQIELRHLRYFHELSKELHFKKAADKLFISQPGLSRQIKQLEEFIGTKLFERDKKNVNLTEAGKYLTSEAEYILNLVNSTISQCKQIAEGTEGEVKIGFVGSAMQNIIPSLIIEVDKSFPGISFSFEETPNLMQVENLLSGEIDLGFIRLDRVHEDLILTPIFQDTFSLVLPKNHPINSRNFKSIDQLKDASFILFQKNYSPAYYAQIMSICEDHGFSPKIVHNTVHASTIFRLVENQLGVSIVPTALKHGFDMNVKFIELSKIRQRAKLSVAWNKKNRNPALQPVLDIVKSKLHK